MTKSKKNTDGIYFKEAEKVEFISSGCTVLDCALGGGWAERRVANLIGDSSSGKTQLAEEACINFLIKYPDGEVHYHETESAFDEVYAATIGLNVDMITFVEDEDGVPIKTVEGFYDKVNHLIDYSVETGKHIFYVLDSLDALAGLVELDEELNKADYGAKAKNLSSMFRRISTKMKRSNLTLLVVSQIRQNVGVTFGRKWRVGGGEALKFYSSQRVFLKEIGKVFKTINSVKRAIGISTRAQCIKNKVGPPLRECEFNVMFYFGIDDISASIDWLSGLNNSNDIFKDIGLDVFNDKGAFSARKLTNCVGKIYSEKNYDLQEAIKNATIFNWDEIEKGFLPLASKYPNVSSA